MARTTIAEKHTLIERTKAAALERNAARCAELLALVHRKMTSVVESFYDVGEALREVLDKRLFLAAGHDTFELFLEREGLMSRRQAGKLIAVARKVPREHALALGHERAYALMVYAEATAANDSVVTLLTNGATVAGKPVADVSLREITSATRALRAKTQQGRAKSEEQRERERADEALAKVMRDAMRGAGFGRAQVSVVGDEVRVVVSRAQVERLAD